jgi:hypothetical protein
MKYIHNVDGFAYPVPSFQLESEVSYSEASSLIREDFAQGIELQFTDGWLQIMGISQLEVSYSRTTSVGFLSSRNSWNEGCLKM